MAILIIIAGFNLIGYIWNVISKYNCKVVDKRVCEIVSKEELVYIVDRGLILNWMVVMLVIVSIIIVCIFNETE